MQDLSLDGLVQLLPLRFHFDDRPVSLCFGNMSISSSAVANLWEESLSCLLLRWIKFTDYSASSFLLVPLIQSQFQFLICFKLMATKSLNALVPPYGGLTINGDYF